MHATLASSPQKPARRLPLVLPDVIRGVMEASFVMPWRMTYSGTLPTFVGAKQGPW